MKFNFIYFFQMQNTTSSCSNSEQCEKVDRPAVLHVLWFVHACRDLNLEVLCWTVLGRFQLIPLWRLGTCRCRPQQNLIDVLCTAKLLLSNTATGISNGT